MKHYLGLFFLLVLVSSCSKTEENASTHTRKSLNPQNSEYYKAVTIYPITGMEKDTFQLGDTLKVKAWFNENISMLINIAEKEGWNYSMQFEKGNNNRPHFKPNAGDTGIISFIVQDTTLAPGEVKMETFTLHASFGYWDEDRTETKLAYDTTFVIHDIPYYIAN